MKIKHCHSQVRNRFPFKGSDIPSRNIAKLSECSAALVAIRKAGNLEVWYEPLHVLTTHDVKKKRAWLPRSARHLSNNYAIISSVHFIRHYNVTLPSG